MDDSFFQQILDDLIMNNFVNESSIINELMNYPEFSSFLSHSIIDNSKSYDYRMICASIMHKYCVEIDQDSLLHIFDLLRDENVLFLHFIANIIGMNINDYSFFIKNNTDINSQYYLGIVLSIRVSIQKFNLICPEILEFFLNLILSYNNYDVKYICADGISLMIQNDGEIDCDLTSVIYPILKIEFCTDLIPTLERILPLLNLIPEDQELSEILVTILNSLSNTCFPKNSSSYSLVFYLTNQISRHILSGFDIDIEILVTSCFRLSLLSDYELKSYIETIDSFYTSFIYSEDEEDGLIRSSCFLLLSMDEINECSFQAVSELLSMGGYYQECALAFCANFGRNNEIIVALKGLNPDLVISNGHRLLCLAINEDYPSFEDVVSMLSHDEYVYPLFALEILRVDSSYYKELIPIGICKGLELIPTFETDVVETLIFNMSVLVIEKGIPFNGYCDRISILIVESLSFIAHHSSSCDAFGDFLNKLILIEDFSQSFISIVLPSIIRVCNSEFFQECGVILLSHLIKNLSLPVSHICQSSFFAEFAFSGSSDSLFEYFLGISSYMARNHIFSDISEWVIDSLDSSSFIKVSSLIVPLLINIDIIWGTGIMYKLLNISSSRPEFFSLDCCVSLASIYLIDQQKFDLYLSNMDVSISSIVSLVSDGFSHIWTLIDQEIILAFLFTVSAQFLGLISSETLVELLTSMIMNNPAAEKLSFEQIHHESLNNFSSYSFIAHDPILQNFSWLNGSFENYLLYLGRISNICFQFPSNVQKRLLQNECV